MRANEELYKLYLQSSGVTTDSRHIEEGMVFFSLKGENFDGNKYASEALLKGAKLAVIDDEANDKGSGYFLVENVLKALQELAAHHRKLLDIPLIALTGTNGKTTTKELIKVVLDTKYKTQATVGNLNNHIGVPLSLLNISPDDEMAVIEMGANHQGEIADLCTIAKPGCGMITNIGKAHLEGFGSLEGVIKAKSEMYDHLLGSGGVAFVNHDDSLLMELAAGLSIVTYGKDKQANVHAAISNSVPFLELQWGDYKIETQLYGEYNFENVMAAICVGVHFKVDPADITEAIANYIPSNNRSQVVKTASNTIFLDAYNANPSSMMASISQFTKQEAGNKVLILGDMLELGDVSQEEHKKIISEVEDKFNTVILVGPEFSNACSSNTINVFDDTNEAMVWLRTNILKDASILIKGSRGIALEKLLDAL